MKAVPIDSSKISTVAEDLHEAMEEVKLAKAGKIKLKSFDDFLNKI